MSEDVGAAPRKKRRILKFVLVPLVVIAILYLLALGGLRLQNSLLPDDAPKIAMTPDDEAWYARLGATAMGYDQIFTRAGGKLVKLEIPEKTGLLEPAEAARVLEGMDALLLSGGGDVDPELYGGERGTAELVSRQRDDFEISLIAEARRRNIPILGVCRGCQILNVAFGGALIDLDDDKELKKIHFGVKGHPIEIEKESLLAAIMHPGKIDNVKSYHSQAVGRLGKGVRAVARSPEGTVEAIEVSELENEWTVAVQWHPEMTLNDELQFSLIKTFVDEARRRRPVKETEQSADDTK